MSEIKQMLIDLTPLLAETVKAKIEGDRRKAAMLEVAVKERENIIYIYEETMLARIAELEGLLIELEARPAQAVHVDAAQPPAPKLAIGDLVWWDNAIRHVVSRDYVQSAHGNFWEYGLSINESAGHPSHVASESALFEYGDID